MKECTCPANSAGSSEPKSLDGNSSPLNAPDISLIDAMIRMEMAMAHLCEQIEALVNQNTEMLDQLIEQNSNPFEDGEPTHYLSGKPVKS